MGHASDGEHKKRNKDKKMNEGAFGKLDCRTGATQPRKATGTCASHAHETSEWLTTVGTSPGRASTGPRQDESSASRKS